MEQTLKQRLVGAAVIIAIGIIVIPMILDGSGERQLRKMPDAPKASRHSAAGLVTREPVPVSTTRETGQIVLTLPEDNVSAAVQTPENEKAPEPIVSSKLPERIKPVIKNPPPEPPVKDEESSSEQKEPPPEPVVKTPKPTPATQQEEAASPDSNTQPTDVWVVQVGSFTDAKKAFAYRDKLISKKHKAFVEKINGRSGKNLYRVRVGPMPKREQADNMEAQLKQQGIKGFVTRHP